MENRITSPASDHVELLERISTRIRTGDPPDRIDVEQALEGAFGCLIGLEAQLVRARDRPAGGDPSLPQADDLRRSIDLLRRALADLRTLSSPSGPPRIGYGFVLPGRRFSPSAPAAASPAKSRHR